MKQKGLFHFIKQIVPWLITAGAIYWMYHTIDWQRFIENVRKADFRLVALASSLTLLSYLLRARRWQILFPRPALSYFQSVQVLILGFFMNNALPARTGEFVRAHLGSKVSGESRTLTLATIASERLTDGLALSLFFVLFSLHIGSDEYSYRFLFVAAVFAAACVNIIGILIFRERLFQLGSLVAAKYKGKAYYLFTQKVKIFLDGLSPLCSWPRWLFIAAWSVLIWSVELGVFYSISLAFGEALPLPLCVLFMVAVNFISLIPAAPGGIGTIELLATAVLHSVGIEKELALSMVLTQHILQELAVGIPGVLFLSTWKGMMKEVPNAESV